MVKKVNDIETTDTSDLLKKAGYNSKSSKIEKKINDHDHSNKNITTQEFNKLTSENFDARLKQANLTSKNEIADFVTNFVICNFVSDLLTD